MSYVDMLNTDKLLSAASETEYDNTRKVAILYSGHRIDSQQGNELEMNRSSGSTSVLMYSYVVCKMFLILHIKCCSSLMLQYTICTEHT